MTIVYETPPPKRKLTRKQFKEELEAIRAEVHRQRDKLRGLLDEAEALESSCDQAIEDVGRAIDTLSEFL